MLKLITISLFILLAFTNFECQKKSSEVDRVYTDHFKGRLEIKGICMNYTIKLLEGEMDPALYQKSWTDQHSGKTHTNVFALASQCTFPAEIKEGDEFYFKIETETNQNCGVCLAFYPAPSKKLAIRIISNP
ncbi:MAG: hypothetical protein ACR2KB_13945 [Chitinophagaceae bacterium]